MTSRAATRSASQSGSGTLTALTTSIGLAVGGRRSEPLRGERQDQQRRDVRREQDELLRHRVGEGIPDGGGRGEPIEATATPLEPSRTQL